MADSNEPKKETVRITLPPRAGSAPPDSNSESVRINLPPRPPGDPAGSTLPPRPPAPPPSIPRPPMAPPLRPTVSAGTPPPPAPPVFSPPSRPAGAIPPPPSRTPVLPPQPPRGVPPPPARVAVPSNYPQPSGHVGPKKETARISILPESGKPSGTVKMAKTQPLLNTPPPVIQRAPVNVTSAVPAVAMIDSIPRALIWALVGGSALTFVIQLWNYFST